MSAPHFATVPDVEPVVELGTGQTFGDEAKGGRWDLAHWDTDDDAHWSGAEPSWVDVTCDVRAVDSTVGHDRTLDAWDVGTCTVTVDNASGWADLTLDPLDPDELSLRPGRAIRWGIRRTIPGYTIPGTPQVDGWLTPTVGVATTNHTPEMATGTAPVQFTFRLTNAVAFGSIDQFLTAQWSPANTWFLAARTTGLVFGVYGADGIRRDYTLANVAQMTPHMPVGSERWLRVDLTPDYDRVVARTIVSVSTDGTTWATVATTASQGRYAMRDPTSPLMVGSHVGSTSSPWRGKVYEGQLVATNRRRFVFPGVAGNYMSVPDSTPLRITGDIEVVARVAPTTWLSRVVIVCNDTTGALPRGWIMRIGSAGQIEMIWPSADGTTQTNTGSTALGFAEGTGGWVKVTRLAATGAVAFYSAPDAPTEPATWTARGTGTTYVGALPAAARGMFLGARLTGGSTEPFAGAIRRVIVRNGVGGSVVLDVNETNPSPVPAGVTSFTATTGQTVTVAQTAGSQVAGAILNEPFNDLAAWVGSSGTITTGRNGTGLRLPGTQTYEYAIAGASQSEWVTIGFAYRAASLTANRHPLILRSDGLNGTNHTTVRVSPDGSLSVLRGGITGPSLATSAPGLAAANVWAYIELRVRLHDTAGEGTLRVNNVEVASFTGQDTKNLGTKTVYDTVALIGTTGVNEDFDDLYLKVGAGASFGGDTAIGTPTDPIVQALPDALVWRFDANDYPGTGTSYVDPRGRTWTLSAAGAITPKVSGVPDVVVPPSIETTWRFRGFIDAIRASYAGPLAETDVATLDCIDALGEVARAQLGKVEPPVGANEGASARLHRILDLVGWRTEWRDIDPSNVPLFATPLGAQAADLLTRTADSVAGALFGDYAGRVAFRNRDWQTWVPGTPPDLVLGNTAEATVCPSSIEVSFPRAGTTTRSLVNYQDAETPPVQVDDVAAQVLYGVETTPERLDLQTSDPTQLDVLAERLIATRGTATMPRIESLTLDAGRDEATMLAMLAADPQWPSRWHLVVERGGRPLLDRMLLVTSVSHSWDAGGWRCSVRLDDATPWAAAGGRWDGAYWGGATWADGALVARLDAVLLALKEAAA